MTRFRIIKQLAIALSALPMLSAPTAASAHSNGSVNCALATTPLQFGEYAPFLGAPSDFTATITVICTTAAIAAEPWDGTIALIGAGRPGARQLRQGPHPLDYRLYLDPARTQPWGDGSGEGALLPVSGTVGPATPYRRVIVVYGRIPALQTSATVGRYTDQITALLDY
ncbi:MAG: spore coat U domain-containing protein [Sphingomicrobium sp.]